MIKTYNQALILARGGSKRLPKKNIRFLGEKPLISWSIDAAKSIPEICEIMVSTDDIEIKTIAEKFGAYVPWLRPYELATDFSSSADAALHALDWYEDAHGLVDGVLLLQPTSPFRTQQTIKEGIALFLGFNLSAVVGVSPTHSHPKWIFRIKDIKSIFERTRIRYTFAGSRTSIYCKWKFLFSNS